MKRSILFLAFLIVLICPIFAYEPDDQVVQLELQIDKIKMEMIRLENKLKNYPPGSPKAVELNDILDGQRARLEKLDAQLKKLRGPQEIVVSKEPIQLTAEAEESVQTAQPQIKKIFALPSGLGINFGAFAGATAVNAELKFKLPYIREAVTASSRVTLGYALSGDGSRKYVPLGVDAMLNYPPGYVTGVDNYLGLGLNYVVVTSGRVSGTIGGQVFYGVESDGFGGKLFGELGYAVLRTGFGPSHQGVTLLIGYRKI